MGLGASTYFIPFFFVLEPALILAGSWQGTVLQTLQVLTGITLIAGAMQGNLLLFGLLTNHLLVRLALGAGGMLIALPSLSKLGLPWADGPMFLAGLALVLVCLATSAWLSPRLPEVA